jgi:metal iron transporter
MLASAVFFYGRGNTSGDSSPASLFDAYDLIRDLVGQGTISMTRQSPSPHLCVGAATLFAVALLAAGQVSWILSFSLRDLF